MIEDNNIKHNKHYYYFNHYKDGYMLLLVIATGLYHDIFADVIISKHIVDSEVSITFKEYSSLSKENLYELDDYYNLIKNVFKD
jgi:hypothetical protein